MLLSWCYTYKLFDEDHSPYCYNNVFADLNLNSGDEPDGIYGYVDVFTFEGWAECLLFAVINFFVMEFLTSTILMMMFGMVALSITYDNPSFPLCTTGVWAITGTDIDICEWFDLD